MVAQARPLRAQFAQGEAMRPTGKNNRWQWRDNPEHRLMILGVGILLLVFAVGMVWSGPVGWP